MTLTFLYRLYGAGDALLTCSTGTRPPASPQQLWAVQFTQISGG